MAGLLNMVRQTVSAVASSGVGAVTLSTAAAGYLTFAQAGAVNGKSYGYSIIEGNKFEIGRGAYSSTGPTLSRDRIFRSSTGSGFADAETFTSAAIVMITPAVEDTGEFPVEDLGNSGTGTVTLDWSKEKVKKLTSTGNHTWAFSNLPPAGTLNEIQIQGINLGAYTLTLPTITWLKGDGSSTSTFSQTGVTLQTSGLNTIYLWCFDGSTVYGRAA